MAVGSSAPEATVVTVVVVVAMYVGNPFGPRASGDLAVVDIAQAGGPFQNLEGAGCPPFLVEQRAVVNIGVCPGAATNSLTETPRRSATPLPRR